MGLLLSTIQESLKGFSAMEARILMMGLNFSGKTTILYKLKLNEFVSSVGFNVERVDPIKNVSFTIWHFGSRPNLKPWWKHYFPNTDGLVFVVDSVALERFEESRSYMDDIIQYDGMQAVPFVVLANKQDLPGARSPSEVAEQLGLWKLVGHGWHMQGCSAVSGQGLVEGLEKLSDVIRLRRETKTP